ncbi:MAG: hypothetical protein ACP5LA_07295, partial [Thermoplasmata archaeon]
NGQIGISFVAVSQNLPNSYIPPYNLLGFVNNLIYFNQNNTQLNYYINNYAQISLNSPFIANWYVNNQLYASNTSNIIISSNLPQIYNVYWTTGSLTSYVYTFQFINDSYASDIYNQINENNIISNGGTTNKNQYSLSFSVNSNTQINYISILLGTYNISYGTFNTGQVNFSLSISGNGINANLGDYSINSNELDNNLYEMILSTLFNPISLNS